MDPIFNLKILEMVAITTCLCNIYLMARANIWNWLFGIVTVSCYAIIFFNVKLYADMSLQGIFFTLQFYGLYQWLYGSSNKYKLSVTNATFSIYCWAFGALLILFAAISTILQNYTDSTTVYLDALVTALSLVAQWMSSKKWLEHWLFWMVVDIISIILYFSKGLYLTAGLYIIIFNICIYGYFTWRPLVEKRLDLMPVS